MTISHVNQLIGDAAREDRGNWPITLAANAEDCLRIAKVPPAAAALHPEVELGTGPLVCYLYVGPDHTLYRVGENAMASQVRRAILKPEGR